MTKQEIVGYYDKLDRGKYSALDHGVTFQFVLRDRQSGNFLHTGIGTGEDMSALLIFELLNLYRTAAQKNVTIVEYAESIKETIIKASEDKTFEMRDY